MSKDEHDIGFSIERSIQTAATLILLGHGRPMTAEAISERIMLGKCIDGPCSATDVLTWAMEKGCLNEHGLIWFKNHTEHACYSDFRKAIFWSFRSRPIGYQRLAVAAMFSIILFIQTQPEHDSAVAIRQLLKAGLNRVSLAAILRIIEEMARARNLSERLGINAWRPEWIRDLGRLINAVSPNGQEKAHPIGEDWWILAHVTNEMQVDESYRALGGTTTEFPYDHWIQLRAPGREFFFPDASFAAVVFAHYHSLQLGDICVMGYCSDEDERDGLRLLLTVLGIGSELYIAQRDGHIPLTARSGTSVVTAPVDAAKALRYAKEFLRNASLPGHRRLFLVAPMHCFQGKDNDWVKVRREMVERDLLDCMLTLPQERKKESELGMFVMDNNKCEDAKGLVLFAGGPNNIEIANPNPFADHDFPDRISYLAKVKAFRFRLQFQALDRNQDCLLIKNSTILSIASAPLGLGYVADTFSVISKLFPWNELEQFKEIQDITNSSVHLTSDDVGDITESVIGALRLELVVPEYLRREMQEPYVKEQVKHIEKYSPAAESLHNIYIRIPSIETQLRSVVAHERSWGLLPTNDITDNWIADLVDNIQLRTGEPEQCKETLAYIIRELQRSERSRALADAEEAYKAYRHDLGNKTGRIRDSISLLKAQLKKPGAYSALLKDTHERLESTLSGLDRFFDEMKGLLLEQEKCFSNERYTITAVELSEVLDNVIRGFNATDVHIEYQGGPVRVWADRQKLEQLVTNIVENAIRHGKVTGRKLWIILDQMEDWVDGVANPDQTALFIANNGKALERNLEELAKQGRRSKRSKGEGLGLYLAQKWAKGMGGDLKMTHGRLPSVSNIYPPLSVGFCVYLRRAS